MKSFSSVTAFLKGAFATPARGVVSLAIALGAAYALVPFVQWAVIDAAWTGASAADCQGKGACWIFLGIRFDQIVYGSYPAALHWRVDVAAALGMLGAGLLFFTPPRPEKVTAAGIFFAGYTLLAGVLLRGGILGLDGVPTRLWGGLMLTVIIAAWTIASAIPIGLVLALARRSRLPVIALLAAAFTDVTRSLPLVGLLFLAIVLFPLFLPPGTETDRLIRVLMVFTIFNAANLAEVFRGGLQAVPKGQSEAGWALGLPAGKVTWKIVVPQAVYISIPATVNVCIAIVKETTIVLIVGMFDFLGVLQAALSDPDWLQAKESRVTAYFFAAVLFWVVCYGLSLCSLRLEKGRKAGQR